MSLRVLNDADLVRESLAGNRDAFGHIIGRYQTLICSLAYSATGNLSQSEDLAQDTFVIAWRHLRDLREPAKLRSWLCSIARNLINHALRRLGNEPSYAAEPLESVRESHSPHPLPVERAISSEEAEILWRSLERIPEIYRETLVLFYREYQSVPVVAQALDLTVEAVHQRLSRGRKLLQEQVLAFIEGALERTKPDKKFTLGVVAALPLLATGSKAAASAATAAKSSAIVKATGTGAFFEFVLKMLLPLAPILSMGGIFGYKMGGDTSQSPRKRQLVVTFWRVVVGSLAVFFALPFLLVLVRAAFPVVPREELYGGLTIWLGLMYAIVPSALILWAWKRRHRFLRQGNAAKEAEKIKRRPFKRWVALAMVGAACIMGLSLSDTLGRVQHLNTDQFRELIAEGKNKDLRFSIFQYQNGRRFLLVTIRKDGKSSHSVAPVDNNTLALLKDNGISYPTYVQGCDFEIFGWPGRYLVFFCIFILAMGAVVLLVSPAKGRSAYLRS
jgi:RNA polymerase sigma factor (sigma-70 family)